MKAPEPSEDVRSHIVADKTAARAALLATLRSIDAEQREARSAVIRKKILESEQWQRARKVLLFTPMRSEPDIRPLEQAAEAEGKSAFAIPSTIRVEADLELPFTPDLVLVPGLGFTTEGHRLGRGGGFYDRLLAGRARNAVKLGICFAVQLLPALPLEPHDTLLDGVISD